MTSLDETRTDRLPAADVIGGLLAVSSIVLSGIAMGFGLLLQLDAHPARLAPVAIVVALVAARMSARFQSLALKAALFGIRVRRGDDRRRRHRRPAVRPGPRSGVRNLAADPPSAGHIEGVALRAPQRQSAKR